MYEIDGYLTVMIHLSNLETFDGTRVVLLSDGERSQPALLGQSCGKPRVSELAVHGSVLAGPVAAVAAVASTAVAVVVVVETN